jgi:GDP-mannose 6-dehydrogenase
MGDAILAIVKTEEAANPERVAVLGLGYVGCVTAACLASLGHRVIGVDRDEFKVAQVMEGRAPFYEPGLGEMVQKAAQRGLLTATSRLDGCIEECDITLICVGTPSEPNGNIGLGQLRRACEEIAGHLHRRARPLIVVVRSTVFPGTCEEVVIPALGDRSKFVLVSNPEFLREGVAVKDFVEPALVVVGGEDESAVKRVAALYDTLDVEPCLVTLRTAEMIKYACNCFHALKIGFANEIGSLCGRLDIRANEVMTTLCRDDRLNISPAYLKPGFAFGGSCLPKDLRALTYRASRLDLDLPLLQHVMASNDAHLKRAIERVLSLEAMNIGVFGLAFKENTDDLRESPVVTLIEHLIGKGRELRIFDPHIQLDQIYGSNRQFVLNAIPHVGRLMVGELESMLDWAESVVITQKPSGAAREQIERSGKKIVNIAEMR